MGRGDGEGQEMLDELSTERIEELPPINPAQMWHVAPSWEQEEIESTGLQPNAPNDRYPEGVYLFADRENALFFAEVMAENAQQEYGGSVEENTYLLYQVDASECQLQEDPAVSAEDDFQHEYPLPIRSLFSPQPLDKSKLQLTEEIEPQ